MLNPILTWPSLSFVPTTVPGTWGSFFSENRQNLVGLMLLAGPFRFIFDEENAREETESLEMRIHLMMGG
jgi:hypothetical protein